MKIPAYITRTYLAKLGHRVKIRSTVEEYTLDSHPGIVFVCKPPQNGAIMWTVTTRKLEAPSTPRE